MKNRTREFQAVVFLSRGNGAAAFLLLATACGSPPSGDEFVGEWKVPTTSPYASQYELDLEDDGTGEYRTYWRDSEYGDASYTYPLTWEPIDDGKITIFLDCTGPSTTCVKEFDCKISSDENRMSCEVPRQFDYERVG